MGVEAGRKGCRHRAARPCAGREEAVRVVELEDARGPAERCAGDEAGDRQHAALADQRAELQGRRQERDQVDAGQGPLEDESAQPVVGCGEPSHDRVFLPSAAGLQRASLSVFHASGCVTQVSEADNSGESPGLRRENLVRTSTGTIATACALSAALLVAGCGGDGGKDTKSSGEVFLQPVAAQGPDPFTDSTATAASTPSRVTRTPQSTPAQSTPTRSAPAQSTPTGPRAPSPAPRPACTAARRGPAAVTSSGRSPISPPTRPRPAPSRRPRASRRAASPAICAG